MVVLVVGDEVHRLRLRVGAVHDDLRTEQAVEQVDDARVALLAPAAQSRCRARFSCAPESRGHAGARETAHQPVSFTPNGRPKIHSGSVGIPHTIAGSANADMTYATRASTGCQRLVCPGARWQ